MRTRVVTLALALLAASVPPAAAQQPVPTPPSSPFGTVDFGFRASSIEGDSARFQRFRDIREQGAGLRFTVARDGSTWAVKALGTNVGYRDQRFNVLAASRRFTVTFDWSQTPLFYGNTTATPYNQASPGVFTLDPAVRTAVQNGTAIGIPRTPSQAQAGSIYRGFEQSFDLRATRDTAAFTLAYAATRQVTLSAQLRTYGRSGAQPWGVGFGFSALPEVALPLDSRTTDFGAGVEWAHARGMVRIGYEGSYFDNRIETLTVDNPQRATSYSQNPWTATGYDPSGYVTGNGAAQGRMALAPSNHTNGVNGLALVKLPRRSSLTGAFSVVGMRQDAALIPWTSNAVIADPRVYAQFPGLASLDRQSADAKVGVVNGSLNFTTHPHRAFGLTAKYRFFNRDSQTPLFDATDYVRMDATPLADGSITRQLDLTRHTFDADATFTPIRYTALRIGVGRDRLEHARVYSTLQDTTFRASAHVTGYQYAGVRAVVEHTVREGSGFDDAMLTAAGAQPASRYYDDAGRTRNRGTLLLDVTPVGFLGLNASVFAGRDDYDDNTQQFGLLNNDNTGYTVGLSVVPARGVAFGATYGYERYEALQRSRAATAVADASWTDPARNWTLDSDETVNNVQVNLDLIRVLRNVEIRARYDWSDSDAGFTYSGARIDALAAIGQFVPLPSVTNAWQRATLDARYFFSPRVGIGAGYWYDKYDVEDYETLDRADGAPSTDSVGALMLGYGYRPFKANTGFVNVFYAF